MRIGLTRAKITWCPGCGNYGVLAALRRALEEVGAEPSRVVLVAGIGCHGRIADYLNVNSIHTIHGRVLPVAIGVKLANPALTVICHSGDGDAYAIGLGHLPHAARYNVPITLVVHNNMLYALTAGQASPTSPRGLRTRSTPHGQAEEPLNPILLALASGATFVARGFSGDVGKLAEILVRAMRHRGFAFVDVLQPCITFYDTYDYIREKAYYLEEEQHDARDLRRALSRALERDRIPLGVFYESERPTMLDRLPPPKCVELSELAERFR